MVTVEELDRLNHVDLFDSRIAECFKEYLPPRNLEYDNHLNRVLGAHSAPQRTVVAQAQPFSVERMILEVRQVLSTVSQENVEGAHEKLQKIRLPETHYQQVAEIFQQALMDSLFLIRPYLQLFQNYKLPIWEKLIELIWQQNQTNQKFEETACETAEHKGKRWFVTNCVVLTEMYLMGHLELEPYQKEVLIRLLKGAEPDDGQHAEESHIQHLEALCKVLPILGIHIPDETAILEHLTRLSNDTKKYPPRLRFMIKDLLDKARKGWKI